MATPQKYLIEPVQQRVTDNIDQLLNVLPPEICRSLKKHNSLNDLLEIVMDLGREPEGRFPNDVYTILDRPVNQEDLDYVAARVGAFGSDNRAGIERTLHRISAIRNRTGRIVGLTCRIGRAVFGTVDIIRDVVEQGKSVLMLGRPGVGKCVTGETLVFTEQGMKPIAALRPDGKPDDEGFLPMHVTVAGQAGIVPASHFFVGGEQDTIRIQTNSGYSLEGTREHPILTLDENGQHRFTRLDQIQPGAFVLVSLGQGLFGCTPLDSHTARQQGVDAVCDPDARFPTEILGAVRDSVAAYLRGLFDAAAEVGEDHITLSVPSESLATTVHVVLLNFGVAANLRRRWCDDCVKYSVAILGADVARYAREIGLTGEDRSDALQQAAARAAEEMSNALEIASPDPVSTSLLDSVQCVEFGRAEVFDLSVPGDHAFFGNGFINHNTTKLREVARILSEEFRKRVVIVDTSNEIAGDGDIPHPAIGRARRMQVPTPAEQHAVMIEAVENHMPEVVVIDEIGTEQEAFASRTIAERGVQLIGTAHGNSLENLLMNPTLSDLVGGIQAVTLSDEEAKRRGTQKTVLERKAPPTFDVIIEILEVDKLAIHHDVMATVDRMLRGAPPRPEIRVRNSSGDVEVVQKEEASISGGPIPRGVAGSMTPQRLETSSAVHDTHGLPREAPPTLRIYPYGVSRNRLEKAIRELRLPMYITKDLNDADAVIVLKSHARGDSGRLQEALNRGVPTFVVRSNTYAQVANALRDMFDLPKAQDSDDDEDTAVREAREAADRVMEFGEPVELTAQNSYIRRLQHELIQTYAELSTESVGSEPNRRLRIVKR